MTPTSKTRKHSKPKTNQTTQFQTLCIHVGRARVCVFCFTQGFCFSKSLQNVEIPTTTKTKSLSDPMYPSMLAELGSVCVVFSSCIFVCCPKSAKTTREKQEHKQHFRPRVSMLAELGSEMLLFCWFSRGFCCLFKSVNET